MQSTDITQTSTVMYVPQGSCITTHKLVRHACSFVTALKWSSALGSRSSGSMSHACQSLEACCSPGVPGAPASRVLAVGAPATVPVTAHVTARMQATYRTHEPRCSGKRLPSTWICRNCMSSSTLCMRAYLLHGLRQEQSPCCRQTCWCWRPRAAESHSTAAAQLPAAGAPGGCCAHAAEQLSAAAPLGRCAAWPERCIAPCRLQRRKQLLSM